MTMKSICNRIITYYKEGSFMYHLKVSLWRNRKLYKIYDIFAYTKKINNKKIVFSNMNGVGYGGDPKYISDYILNNKLQYELVWLVDKYLCKDIEAFPKEVKVVDLYSIKGLEELSTAHFWVDNCRKLIIPPKKKGQIYIQTWHGTFPSKYIEKDAENDLDKTYIKNAKIDSANIDYIISGCKYKTEIYQNSFYYNGKILEVGTPKEDMIFDCKQVSKAIIKVKRNYNIDDNVLIILYAPTFRKNMSLDIYDINYKLIIEAFEKRYNKECKILVRLHPNMVEKSDRLKIPNYVINVTDYPDMQELLCASDFIISDYSSTLDYSLWDKPILLYCPDLESYQKNERRFYIKLQELPFPIAETNEQLIENIKNFDQIQYIKKLHKIYEKYGLCEKGNSCQKIIEMMDILCEEKK